MLCKVYSTIPTTGISLGSPVRRFLQGEIIMELSSFGGDWVFWKAIGSTIESNQQIQSQEITMKRAAVTVPWSKEQGNHS